MPLDFDNDQHNEPITLEQLIIFLEGIKETYGNSFIEVRNAAGDYDMMCRYGRPKEFTCPTTHTTIQYWQLGE
jgi:hypothetical protein